MSKVNNYELTKKEFSFRTAPKIWRGRLRKRYFFFIAHLPPRHNHLYGPKGSFKSDVIDPVANLGTNLIAQEVVSTLEKHGMLDLEHKPEPRKVKPAESLKKGGGAKMHKPVGKDKELEAAESYQIETKNAKLSLVSKPVPGGLPAEHLFIVKTNPDGTREIARGGPATYHLLPNEKADIGAITQDIEVVYGNYYGSKDWVEDDVYTTLPKVTYEGNVEDINIIWSKMKKGADLINSGKFDYELPILETIMGKFGIGINSQNQNSNTVARTIWEFGGLKFEKPLRDGKPVNIPGADASFHSTVPTPMADLGFNPTNLGVSAERQQHYAEQWQNYHKEAKRVEEIVNKLKKKE